MKKKLLFWAILGAIILAPAMSWAVSGSSGGSSIDWESKVGKPEDDPNSPSSYESKLKDPQKSSSGGGLHGPVRIH